MDSLAYYQEYIEQLKLALKPYNVHLHIIGEFTHNSQQIPLYAVTVGKGVQKILITAGVHGEEQAGPLSLVEFITHDLGRYLDQMQFTIIPVTNPIGFNKKERRGSGNRDLNRFFSAEEGFPENKIVLEFLEGKKFDHFFDMHEDIEEGAYMYDSGDGVNDTELLSKGYDLLQKLTDKGVKICHRQKVLGLPNEKGIIYTGPYLRKSLNPVIGALTAYLVITETVARSTILETSRLFPLEERIMTQRFYLNYWLRLKM